MAVQILKSDLKALIDAGKKADEIAAHYGIPLGTARKALKEAGLKIKRTQRPRFMLVDEKVGAESHTSPIIHELLDPQIVKDIIENVESHEDTTIDTLPSTEFPDVKEEEVVEEERYYDDRDYDNEDAEEQEQDEVDSQEETKAEDPNDWF